MSKTLRSTGVNVLGDVPWGSHVCVFYESGDDLLDTVIPFFKTGLESNEYCLWALSEPPTMQDARRRAAPAHPGCRSASGWPDAWKSFRGAIGISSKANSISGESSTAGKRSCAARSPRVSTDCA